MRLCSVLLTTTCVLALTPVAQGQPAGEQGVLSRGAAFEERADYAGAKAAYVEGLNSTPRSAELHYRIGLLGLRASDWPAAIHSLERARSLRPRDVDTLYYLAQAYYLDGQRGPARAALARAVVLAPARAEVVQKYGEYLCEDDQCKLGLTYLLKARRLDPHLADIDFDLGMAYHKQAAIPEAQRYLEAALKQAPGNPIAARFLADVLGRQDQWERAKDLYRGVVTRDPGNAWALYGLGRALIGLGQQAAALEPLRSALSADPTIAEAHFQLGQALRQLGQKDESERELDAFKNLRDRKPGPATPVTATRTPFEARVWDTCRRFLDENKEAEALAYLDSLPKEDGLHSSYLLGVLYFNLERPTDAVRLLTRAQGERPRDADVLAFLGRAHVSAGQLDAAAQVLAQARELRPNSELALIGAGELEYAREHWDEASRYFEQSKTAQVPPLLKLCRAYALAGNRAKALETATLVRAFGHDDASALRELDAALAVAPAPSPAASATP